MSEWYRQSKLSENRKNQLSKCFPKNQFEKALSYILLRNQSLKPGVLSKSQGELVRLAFSAPSAHLEEGPDGGLALVTPGV